MACQLQIATFSMRFFIVFLLLWYLSLPEEWLENDVPLAVFSAVVESSRPRGRTIDVILYTKARVFTQSVHEQLFALRNRFE